MKKTAASAAEPRKPGRTRSPIDDYIAGCPRTVQPILRKIRAIVREEAPGATEKISYRMPAFFLDGALIYYAPFTHHVGIYPPVKGDPQLNKALARHRGEKGNLKFALDEPMPYELIRQVVRCRLSESQARAASKRRR
jgi:uncharacterized protein YdhG (YjbR/CyaY superfamily)